MSILKTFKPNLIPNNPKDGSVDLDKIIQKNGGYNQYLISRKKDGCRLNLIESKVLTRALKVPGSKLVVERFQKLANQLKELDIAVDGEFYMHGLKFNAIFRFFSKSDVTTISYLNELKKAQKKDPKKFRNEYDGLSIDFLTNFNHNLKLHIFDGIVIDNPEIVRFEDRMNTIKSRMQTILSDEDLKFIKFAKFDVAQNKEELENLYEEALELGYEGLVLTHKDHEYKFGRNTLNQGTLLKMKDDALEYDGIVLDVLEATSIKEGVERTTNELGRSVTSKKKDDRELSGLAKGLLIQFESLGTFTVGLKGFSNEMKRELLKNKSQYIGRHFKYTGMAPVKDFPRHAYFDVWRDEK